MPFQIVRNDITKMKTDVIVNAANTELRRGSGVCGAIFNAAGVTELENECNKIGHCNVGSAVITKGFGLSKFIIHTVGPVWKGGIFGEKKQLKACYENVLKLAFENKAESIAIPLISAGVYGYPKDKAMKVAIDAIVSSEYLTELDIYLVLFDKLSVEHGKKYSKVQEYINDNYIEHYPYARRAVSDACQPYADMSCVLEENISEPYADMSCVFDANIAEPCLVSDESDIKQALRNIDESFSESLLRLIDEKGLKDSDVYKKANIDRKLFSKIRNNKNYSPRKNTVIAFAIALELTLDETNAFLSKAGYVLSRSNKADIIIEYFIAKKVYDIFEINEALFEFDQALLGA